MYRQLDPEKIHQTVSRLRRRVTERFPDAGLSQVCTELEAVSDEAAERCRWIGEPKLWLRAVIGTVILLLFVSLLATLVAVRPPSGGLEITELIQVLEAGINDLVLLGAAIFFLVTLESRFKRNKALAALHELRALAHVIDMHQLTKDPERLLRTGGNTESSPVYRLTPFELERYLDYCSEMLSIVGKLAALYAQNLGDSVVLAAVTEIEDLTMGLSQKIWQKISAVERLGPDSP